MISAQILDYVRQQLQAGASKENISASLVSSGWSQQDINDIFTKIGTPAPAGSVPIPPVKHNPILTWGAVILVGIVIIGPAMYRAYQAYQARQQLQRQISVVEQQLQQDQQAMNGDTSILGTTTPATSTIAQVNNGATVTSTGTQTVPQDTTGPYGDPRGTVTVSGSASVSNVEIILKPVSYKAGFVTGSPTMYTDTSTDYASNSNTWSVQGPLSVSGGKWSTKVNDSMAGDYTVLVYDSAYKLIGTGKLTVKMGTLWGAPSATIDQSSLVSSSPKPIISGTAINVADVNVQVGNDYYTPHVVNGKWDTSYNPATVVPGTYKVVVKTQDTTTPVVLVTGTLVVK
jgi:cytochrome c-type biogenesis protein CcmH/NrfF